MTDQMIIRLYVEEIAALSADIARLKAKLAACEQEKADALALAAGYKAEVEQVKAEFIKRIELLEWEVQDGR